METKANKKFPFQKELISLIKKEVPIHSVYVIKLNKNKSKQIAYLTPKSEHSQVEAIYTIFIVGNKALHKNLGDFMEEVYNKMEQRCKVNIIFCTLPNLMERIDIGDNFLTCILSDTPCIYREDNALSRYSQYGLMRHFSIYKSIKKIWNDRMERTAYLFSITDVIHENEEPLSKLAVLNNAMVQICLGLLYVFWEFKPHYYTLSYLLNLCAAFTSLPHSLFPRTTFGLQRQYYMLCNAPEIMGFKGTNGTNDFTLRDVDKVLKRCKQFYGEAELLGEKQLEYLRKIHCTTKTHE